jgi:hypothetical protein
MADDRASSAPSTVAGGPTGPGAPLAPGEPDRNLVLDELSERLDALRVLRGDNDEERGRLLAEIGAHGRVEAEMVDQLSKGKPLWLPNRFEEAHRLMIRSLEVLDRNGARPTAVPKQTGPLKPVAQWAVQQFTRWIVKNHQNNLVDRLRKLYELREANSVWGSDEHRMIRRARIDIVRLSTDLKSKPLGLPTFLLGGAFLSGVFGGLQSLIRAAFGNAVLTVILALLFGLLLAGLSWTVIYAAATARRRIRTAVDQPLRALYETIGAAGNPPRDQSIQFAVIALVFTVLAAVVIPVGIALAVRAF